MSRSNSSAQATGGIGFFGALTILFVALKLTHTIEWTWFWVLSPVVFCATIWLAVVIAVLALFMAGKIK